MANPTRTQALKAFLMANTHEDLASLYNHDMECQVIVAQDNGEKIDGEFKGRRWTGYTDGLQTWKPFRIPRNADTEPEYDDVPMTWDLASHAEAIGMTGWDWKSKKSRWVAYDFDAITGHSERHGQKLTWEQLQEVKDAASKIPWVTVRHSTSGQGLHIYVRLVPVDTANHTEHAALARAILAKMAALTAFDFTSKVDICGQNMWIWHRKMAGTNGLRILKEGDLLSDIPPNWQGHIHVVTGRRKKVRHDIPSSKEVPEIENRFEELVSQCNRVKLDEAHRRLLEWLDEEKRFHWWDADNHMLVTHTMHLKTAYTELGMRGIFDTISPGTNLDEQNCFAFPLRKGGWVVRRYSLSCSEHPSWDQDAGGWTKTYLNCEPTLRVAAAAVNGLEDPTGGFVFRTGDDAASAALALGANVKIPAGYDIRPTTIKPHKDGRRIIVEFDHNTGDDPQRLTGWLHKGKKWIKLYSANLSTVDEDDKDDYDDVVRHLVTPQGSDSGWVLNSDGVWHDEPLTHIKSGLQFMGLKPAEISKIVGGNVFKPWKLVTKPFQTEYPGNREWNRNSPQLSFAPTLNDDLNYKTWTSILNHVGGSLDVALQEDQWAKENNIKTGADYLKCWIASMFQFPLEPLPYLFIYSNEQNTGKSILHEALSLLFNPGYQRADRALTNSQGFNGELEGAILCVVEETNLREHNVAYNRIKDWVTSRVLPIHRKTLTPYHVQNTSHWIQCANDRSYCPVFPGDTRIVVIHVPDPPETQIPKRFLMEKLMKEAPDFLAEILRLEIPYSNDRLNIPIINTADKVEASDATKNAVDLFIEEQCYWNPGRSVPMGVFYEKFIAWLDPNERINWNTKQRVTRHMPSRFQRGRLRTDAGQWHWANLSFEAPTEEQLKRRKYVVNSNRHLELESYVDRFDGGVNPSST